MKTVLLWIIAICVIAIAVIKFDERVEVLEARKAATGCAPSYAPWENAPEGCRPSGILDKHSPKTDYAPWETPPAKP